MRVLQIIEAAYRGTLEEQDDTIVWITHAMKGAGAELDVLLRGNAVNYVVESQDASGLSFGNWRQSRPPRIAQDIAALVEKGVAVHVVEEDLEERGLKDANCVAGINSVNRDGLGRLITSYDQVWYW